MNFISLQREVHELQITSDGGSCNAYDCRGRFMNYRLLQRDVHELQMAV